MIVKEILEDKKLELKKREVTDVEIGLNYLGVTLDEKYFGVAFTLRDELPGYCDVMKKSGELEGNAWELAKMAMNPTTLESCLGVATINALINQDIDGEKRDIFDSLEVNKGDKVGMIGKAFYLINKISSVKETDLYVFERDKKKKNIYPDWAIEPLLPKMDVCIITGTTFINKTIDHILDLSRNAREIAILGPSTPMATEIIKDHGATLIGGMEINDIQKAKKIISQAGGAGDLKKAAEKITITL